MAGKPRLSVTLGERFGRGVVLEETRIRDKNGKPVRWVKLQCDCGTIYDTRLGDLLKPDKPTRSCGCLMRETASATMSRPENLARLAEYARSPEGRAKSIATNKATKTTHGLSRTHPLYSTWGNMMTRCYNPKFKQFKDYGERGVTVCERWHDPQLFIEDIERLIGPRPHGMTLDRIDNLNGNYGPGEVKWSTYQEQIRNSRRWAGDKQSVSPGQSGQPGQRGDGTRSGTLYRSWWRLMRRCPDEVYPAWHDWDCFRADIERLLGARPAGGRFDRLNDKLPYAPGNAGWVTGAVQIKRAQEARWGVSRPEPVHGLSSHPLYGTWRTIRKQPGGLHAPWHDVRVFVKEIEALIGPRPAGMAFRLIDPAGRYEPGNICWGRRGRPPRR